MIAGLNMAAVDGNERLAWTRAYGVSIGLVPRAASVHHREYQITEELPENAELATVIAAHPDGEDGQMYIRGCLSIIAAFGALHLANDHTYRPNDTTLLRKAKVMIEACRTCLAEGEADRLHVDAMVNLVMRTTCHPFGLSSTWGLFKDCQRHRLIAEPLQIRDSLVPPPIAKVGVVVAVMSKITSLPVGKLFSDAYADKITALGNLRTTVVANAPAYSGLFRHYGYDAQLRLTSEQETMCDELVPVIAGYSLVFEVDNDGNDRGSLLSHTIQNAILNKSALVALYKNAFEEYAAKATDLKTLVTGSTGSTT
jgi:hypothetical protein